MYRLKEDLTIVSGENCHCHFKKGEDFYRNHVLVEDGQAVVYLSPAKSATDEKVIPLSVFESMFIKIERD